MIEFDFYQWQGMSLQILISIASAISIFLKAMETILPYTYVSRCGL